MLVGCGVSLTDASVVAAQEDECDDYDDEQWWTKSDQPFQEVLEVASWSWIMLLFMVGNGGAVYFS